MIDIKEVITVKVPFPTIADNLALIPHMYICLDSTEDKKDFIKCQTLKTKHLGGNKKPFRRVEENSDITRNPFRKKTLIDCDKKFSFENVEISRDLLTRSRKDVCQSLFNQVQTECNHPDLTEHLVDITNLAQINSKIKVKN